MKCNICGRQTQNEEANFCEYCGGSFREHLQTSFHIPSREQSYLSEDQLRGPNPTSANSAANALPNTAETEKPISFMNWLGTYGMMFIPIVGGLVFLVMLFVWSFDGKTPASKKNWARVTLIFAAVLLVLVIGYFAMVMSSPIFQDIMNEYMTYYEGMTY